VKGDRLKFVGDDCYRFDDSSFLNLNSGVINTVPFYKLEDKVSFDEVELVVGCDEKEIEIKLFTDDGEQNSVSGYLVEVYLSESDRLTKVKPKDTLDPVTGESIEEGFEKYFYLEVK